MEALLSIKYHYQVKTQNKELTYSSYCPGGKRIPNPEIPTIDFTDVDVKQEQYNNKVMLKLMTLLGYKKIRERPFEAVLKKNETQVNNIKSNIYRLFIFSIKMVLFLTKN